MAASSASDLSQRICSVFDIDKLADFQEKAILNISKGKDTYLSCKTGSGKSLTYECALVVFGSGTITLVIAPLTSIMQQQVERLTKLGFTAVLIESSCSVSEKDLVNGCYEFVFGSPELLVGTTRWREVIKDTTFQKRHRLTVVDEVI